MSVQRTFVQSARMECLGTDELSLLRAQGVGPLMMDVRCCIPLLLYH